MLNDDISAPQTSFTSQWFVARRETPTSDIAVPEVIVVVAMTAVLLLSPVIGCGPPVIRGTPIDPAAALRCD